jgi:hypothetical protein
LRQLSAICQTLVDPLCIQNEAARFVQSFSILRLRGASDKLPSLPSEIWLRSANSALRLPGAISDRYCSAADPVNPEPGVPTTLWLP